MTFSIPPYETATFLQRVESEHTYTRTRTRKNLKIAPQRGQQEH